MMFYHNIANLDVLHAPYDINYIAPYDINYIDVLHVHDLLNTCKHIL